MKKYSSEIYMYKMTSDGRMFIPSVPSPERSDGTCLETYMVDSEACSLALKRCKGPLPDMFMSGSVYVFSDKARCLINELRMDSGTQWIDVSVSVGDSLRGNCYAITSDKSHAILDLELSDYSWLIPGKLADSETMSVDIVTSSKKLANQQDEKTCIETGTSERLDLQR